MAAPSLFCVFWIRNTIRNVMMVVLVFMTNCQVLLNPKCGPQVAQTRMIITAAAKVAGCPVVREARLAKLSNRESWSTTRSFHSLLYMAIPASEDTKGEANPLWRARQGAALRRIPLVHALRSIG